MSDSTSSMSSLTSMDQFLTLFCTQLENQDPLEPMDSSGFTEQLAQLTSVEQLVSINETMDSMDSNMSALLDYSSSLNNQYASTLIGRTVSYGDAGSSDQVTGVSFEDGTTSLVLKSGTSISLGDVTSITG